MNYESMTNDTLSVGVRMAGASSLITHRVPPSLVDEFIKWQTKISEAAQKFSGYRMTEIYPPADANSEDWVVVIEFDGQEELKDWLGSPSRNEWVSRLPSEVAEFKITTLQNGFGPWFSGLGSDKDNKPPAGWKMFLTVLLGLYPTVMLLSIWVGPHLSYFGLSFSMLLSNALSVALLQWAVVPVLTKVLSPWLGGRNSSGWRVNLVSISIILLILTGLAATFRRILE